MNDEDNSNLSACVVFQRERRSQGTVYRLTISRPQRHNAIDSAVLRDLLAALGEIARDPQARVAVLCGAGEKAWIAGADIQEMNGLQPQTAKLFVERLHCACQALRELPVPVIARIVGYCLGAGLELAMSCDLRIAAERSSFGMPEVKLGVPSVIESALLPRLVGAGRARDLVMTGRVLGSNEALAWGLVEAVAAADEFDAVLEERIQHILDGGPNAIRLQKVLCRQWEELPLADAVAASVKTFAYAFESDEPRSYMERFLQSRRNKR
jgi:enoyl-CoA hydratase